MTAKIKLCSMRRSEDIEFANRLLPDYVGYILTSRFRRYIEPSDAKKLTDMLDGRIVPVGVFVDESVDYIVDIAKSGAIRAIQLHGSESEEFIKELKTKISLPVVKFFKADSVEAIKKAEMSKADFILLDSGTGSGKTFDYSLLEKIKREFFLAGGLTADNISDAIKLTKPYCVDTSSGVETDGVKDYNKMKAFCEAVRQG